MKDLGQVHLGWWKTAICTNCVRVGINARFVGPQGGPAKMSRAAKHGVDLKTKIKDVCIPAVLKQFGWMQQRGTTPYRKLPRAEFALKIIEGLQLYGKLF